MSAANQGGERTRGLGRGLSALFDEGGEADETERAEAGSGGRRPAGVREIPIELISANPDQPRRRFTETELSELTDSIAQKGLLQPILVRPYGEGHTEHYQVVAGERRWRAAQRARLHAVPCLVRELTDRETLEIAIVENVQRAELTAVEEARAFRQLIDDHGHTQDEVARAVGKSRAHIANTMRLLNLPDAVLDRLEAGEISAGHARAILGADDPAALAREIVAKGLSVRAAEALARKAAGAPETKGGAKPRLRGDGGQSADKDADTRALEADLAQRLGLAVDIRHAGESGELRIRYGSLEQLDDVCRRLTGRE